MRFQVLAAASMKVTPLWDAEPCSLVKVDRRSRRAYCLRHKGDERRHYAFLKRRSVSTRLHGAVSQNAVIFWSVFIFGFR
jgi:hypothetical protein